MRVAPTHDPYPPLLRTQIRLAEATRARVEALAEASGDHDANLVDAIANDLAGARLVIRAALALSLRQAGYRLQTGRRRVR